MLLVECLLVECRKLVPRILHYSSMENKRLVRQFGNTLRRLRKAKGLSQERFAAHAGLHRTYIGSIERGEKSITLEAIYKIARGLDMPLSRLFGELEAEQMGDEDEEEGGHM